MQPKWSQLLLNDNILMLFWHTKLSFVDVYPEVHFCNMVLAETAPSCWREGLLADVLLGNTKGRSLSP